MKSVSCNDNFSCQIHFTMVPVFLGGILWIFYFKHSFVVRSWGPWSEIFISTSDPEDPGFRFFILLLDPRDPGYFFILEIMYHGYAIFPWNHVILDPDIL